MRSMYNLKNNVKENFMNKKKNNKKTQSQINHFINACITRVGEVLDMKAIISQIQNSELELIDKQSNRVSRWKYQYKGKLYMLCYDSKRNQLATVIPYYEGMENNTLESKYWWLKAGQV